MEFRKKVFFVFASLVSITCILDGVSVFCEEDKEFTQIQESRNVDAIVQRRMMKITPQQREAAAARLRAARIAADPEEAKRLEAAREAQAKAIQARVAVITDTQGENEDESAAEARLEAAKEAAEREASVRVAVANGEPVPQDNKGGQTND